MGLEEIKAFVELLQQDLRKKRDLFISKDIDLCWKRTVGSFHAAPGHCSLTPYGFSAGSGAAAVQRHGAILWVLSSCRESKFLFPRAAQWAECCQMKLELWIPVCLEALFCGIMAYKHSFNLSHS